jgi:oligopeptide transport system ATP-binding protein
MLGPPVAAASTPGQELTVLELDKVTAGYLRPGRFGRTERFTVVHDVDLRGRQGRNRRPGWRVGCGKSTLARIIVGLQAPFSGHVWFNGTDVHRLRGRARQAHRRRVQMVFQDPFASLSPRLRVVRAIAEAMEIHAIGTPRARTVRVAQLLDLVGLDPGVSRRLPRDLSSGERQRVAIARALALEPQLLVCDEPVTALDVSLQAKILNLLLDLRDQLGLACLFIAHDLAVVSRLADRVAVMHLGRIVELAPTAALFDTPSTPTPRRCSARSRGPPGDALGRPLGATLPVAGPKRVTQLQDIHNNVFPPPHDIARKALRVAAATGCRGRRQPG